MLNKKFIKKLKEKYDKRESERRQIISLANIVLHDSKRIIFSLHRGDLKEAEKKFGEVENILKKLEKNFSFNRVNAEGAYKASVEEYVEAKTLHLTMKKKEIDEIPDIKINFDGYLGGICDLTGELVRRAVNEAAGGNTAEVKKIKKIITDIMSELIEFDLTGYLRTKYDQAKTNLRKIEQISYDINIRK